jgi:hypothetical protein
MTEQELRNLVRDAIARHSGQVARPAPASPAFFHLHASHGMFTLPAGADTDGPCLIEPAVMCNHCGYCKSYGH